VVKVFRNSEQVLLIQSLTTRLQSKKRIVQGPSCHIQSSKHGSRRDQELLLDGKLVQRSIGVEQHLCVSINSLVKLVVSINSLVDVDFVRNDKGGLGTARDDEIAELTVVSLDVALAGAEEESLFEELAEGDEQLSFARLRVWSTRVL
jgi:hypothetical protein